MASASPWEDMEGSFFICSVCSNNFTEPKQLPCLHRYCRHCLAPIVEQHRGEFNCPLCNYVCIIPQEGVDGFKTDFHMKSILQLINLQKSVKTDETQTCKGCKKKEKVFAYCFKCKGFLCDQWYQLHLNNDMMHDHEDNVLPLKDIAEKKLSLENLASLTEAPRCHEHVDKLADVCCETCGNLPICMVCSNHGNHKAHQIHDVKEIAIKERNNIQEIIATLDKYKENVHNLPERLEKAKKKLDGNLEERKGKIQSQYQVKLTKIREMLKETDDLLEINKAKIDEIESRSLSELEEKRETAVKHINDKYDKRVNEVKRENKIQRKEQDGMFGEKKANINKKLEFLNKELKDTDKSIDIQGEQGLEELSDISLKSDSRIRRFDTLVSSVSSILASNDDWTDARCLPDVSSASEPLVEDVRKEFSELESLSEITSSDLLPVIDQVKIAENVETVVNIKEIKHKEGFACTTATDAEGRVAITGKVSSKCAYITVVDMKGKLVWQDKRKNVDKTMKNSICYCASMSKYEVVTAYNFNVISIYDIRRGHCGQNIVCNVTRDWLETHALSCIAIDPVQKYIYIGSYRKRDGQGRNVLVFDSKLTFLKTLVLPEEILFIRDLTVHKNNLLVCDADGERAFAVTMEGRESMIIHELVKPNHDGGDWYPCSVCTDNNDFIYILWEAKIDNHLKKVLTQHSQDGLYLLTTKALDVDAFCLTTIFRDGQEKLLVTTKNTGKMYIYCLIREDPYSPITDSDQQLSSDRNHSSMRRTDVCHAKFYA